MSQNQTAAGVTKAKKDSKKYFIAVHLGAGKHCLKEKYTDSYTSLCQKACNKALSILRVGGTADEATVAATVILEDSELVNAGRGSELNSEKKVECDAGFMNGTGYFGGVGAVPGCPNPILVARKIAQLQFTKKNLRPGILPPMLLVGQEAKVWAESQGIPTLNDDQLISQKALKSYDRIIQLTDNIRNSNCKRKYETLEEDNDEEMEDITDTVGCIALDSNGHVAATVSSGGNQLKLPGRIGHSPIFGCGCWADDKQDGNIESSSVAVSTTGVGEMLAKLQWAAECGNCLLSQDHDTPMEAMTYAIEKKFLESPRLKLHSEPKLVGGVALTWDGKHGDLVWGYKSPTFILGYAGSMFSTPQNYYQWFGDKLAQDKLAHVTTRH